MNENVQKKIDEIRKMSENSKNNGTVIHLGKTQEPDSLSTAIHSKRDADHFMAELKAIRNPK